MDVADEADAQIELEQALALTRRHPRGPLAISRCLNCDEPVPPGRRWCDAGCRDDWERRANQQALLMVEDDWELD